MSDKPLAAASKRLKRKPGRPRKADLGTPPGHITGIADSQMPENRGSAKGELAVRACEPRLLSLQDAALYLGVSSWTVRDLEAAGVLPRVRVPTRNNGELRKLLFDRSDLDACVERWKERSYA